MATLACLDLVGGHHGELVHVPLHSLIDTHAGTPQLHGDARPDFRGHLVHDEAE
jgi:hypothetical protein